LLHRHCVDARACVTSPRHPRPRAMGNESSQPTGEGGGVEDRERRIRLSFNARKMMADGHDDSGRLAHNGSSTAAAGGRTATLKEGWLMKKGKFNKAWRRRYFRLTPRTLSYFESPDSLKSKGSVPLSSCTAVRTVEAAVDGVVSPQGTAQQLFQVVISKRVYTLSADTRFDMNDWISTLKGACHGLATGSALAVENRHSATTPGGTKIKKEPSGRWQMNPAMNVNPDDMAGGTAIFDADGSGKRLLGEARDTFAGSMDGDGVGGVMGVGGGRTKTLSLLRGSSIGNAEEEDLALLANMTKARSSNQERDPIFSRLYNSEVGRGKRRWK
jgi:hypothetical protein